MEGVENTTEYNDSLVVLCNVTDNCTSPVPPHHHGLNLARSVLLAFGLLILLWWLGSQLWQSWLKPNVVVTCDECRNDFAPSITRGLREGDCRLVCGACVLGASFCCCCRFCRRPPFVYSQEEDDEIGEINSPQIRRIEVSDPSQLPGPSRTSNTNEQATPQQPAGTHTGRSSEHAPSLLQTFANQFASDSPRLAPQLGPGSVRTYRVDMPSPGYPGSASTYRVDKPSPRYLQDLEKRAAGRRRSESDNRRYRTFSGTSRPAEQEEKAGFSGAHHSVQAASSTDEGASAEMIELQIMAPEGARSRNRRFDPIYRHRVGRPLSYKKKYLRYIVPQHYGRRRKARGKYIVLPNTSSPRGLHSILEEDEDEKEEETVVDTEVERKDGSLE